MPQKVSIIALGGTIAMTRHSKGGAVPTLDGAALVAAVPELASAAQVSATSFMQVPGAQLTLEDVVALSREIRRHVEEGAAGVVVTQGTDTIEEVAFALDLLLDFEATVVVTGAMRNPTVAGADGPANLLAAVQVAASMEARGLGVLVVFNDEIHAARYVQKTHTTSTATFGSPLTGPVGWVIEGRVRIANRPPARPGIKLKTDRTTEPVTPVALLTASLGDDGRLIEEVPRLGYGGLVYQAFGAGHVHPVAATKLKQLASTMPVIMASRTGSGETLRHTYGFPGSESDLLGGGLIGAGMLDGPKARILLSLLLSIGADREAIIGYFAAWSGD